MAKHPLTKAQTLEYTRVAYYYYKEGATQEQIAAQMKMSRQRVNRILNDCLSNGIVQISIRSLDSLHIETESSLKHKFGLQDVRVVDSAGGEEIFHDLGVAGGKYLASILQDGDIIGLTRGKTLADMAEYMPTVRRKGLTVVQLLGSRNREPQNTAANEIVHTFSKHLGAKQSMLFAPIILGSAELKQSLRQEPSFQDSYRMMRSCNIAVVGIGAADSNRLLAGLTNEHVEDTVILNEGQHLAGEVGSHFYDQYGKPITYRYRDRIVAVELEDYLRIPVRIGVAGMPAKAQAIYAALLGKYVNVLITDTETAAILEKM